jgi:hypothetical protein
VEPYFMERQASPGKPAFPADIALQMPACHTRTRSPSRVLWRLKSEQDPLFFICQSLDNTRSFILRNFPH